jgi:adenine phosphoribosyltransferase
MSGLRAEQLVRDIPDFPKPGILFKDVVPVMEDGQALSEVVKALAGWARELNADAVAGVEARGFVFGAPLAVELGVGFIPIRKLGKLPYERVSEEYALEYGTATVEIHADSVKPGQRVVIVDDLLATGGTAAAAAKLVERVGGVVAGMGFLIELSFLDGRKPIADYNVHALITY